MLRYAPARLRWNETIIAAVSCLGIGIVVLPNVPEPWNVVLLAFMVGALAWSVRRAWRLSLRVTADRVCVDNYWRSYRFPWADVTAVGVGSETMGVVPVPAIAFRLRDGRTVRAQATPAKEGPRDDLLDELAGLAPAGVAFHRRS
ncbi:MAG: hypothetical protein QOF43_1557 [Gaiellaceae bacterium]|nr:hypothetical protein [Gaiellaceae bacterium]